MFGLQPWDTEIGSNFKNMALTIAEQNRILYVNRPLDKITYYRYKNNRQVKARLESIQHQKNILQEITRNLWAFNPRIILNSINWLPKGFIYRYFNKKNNYNLAKEIKFAVQKLGFTNVILIIDNDFFNALYLKEYIKPGLFIYYIRDYLLSQSYFKKHGSVAEPLIMCKADAVIANSRYLASYGEKYNSISINIGQGCDVQDFLEKPNFTPADIAAIKKPLIGYCGALISGRLNINLIHSIAKKRPDWSLVFIGPEDDDFKKSALHNIHNVHFLGTKMVSELPAYVHNFDVCINPQLLNQMTIGNYPRKVDEYLAAGKPVVATDTEAMQIFKAFTYLCTSDEDYVASIEKAIIEKDNKQKIKERMEFAKSHTWKASIHRLYEIIKKLHIQNAPEGRNYN